MHNFGLYPSSFAMSASQKNKRIMHRHTQSVLPAADRKDSPCLGFSVEKQQRQQLLQCVLACHSQTKKNMHRSHSDMTDCSDLPLWVLLHFSFFVCLGFVLWVWVFSHSLLFLL